MACLVRGTIVHCPTPPTGGRATLDVYPDGVLLVEDGRIARLGDAGDILGPATRDLPVHDYTGRFILPGLIDIHVHYPQLDIIASHGEKLLDWLDRYTFPAEMAFADQAVAEDTAQFFATELLRNGTTSALVLCTVHPGSVDAIFAAAEMRGMRIAAGKMLMDRNAPAALCDTAASAEAESRALIEHWHGRGRLRYAITPRFAPTSSVEQLAAIGRLGQAFPDTYIHTHLAETIPELDWVRRLFPSARSYLDVYDRHGLVRERSVFAHCIHVGDADLDLMSERGAAAAFCPTSNLFLGSGLFDYARAREAGVRVGLATDVGGGTSLSMFRTAAEAYKVSALRGHPLLAADMLYLCTRAGAEALYLEDKVGSLGEGMEADFIVVDPATTPLTARRHARARGIEEQLFAVFLLGDDRLVTDVYLRGERQML